MELESAIKINWWIFFQNYEIVHHLNYFLSRLYNIPSYQGINCLCMVSITLPTKQKKIQLDQIIAKTSIFRVIIRFSKAVLIFGKKNGPIMPPDQKPHQTVNYCGYIASSITMIQFREHASHIYLKTSFSSICFANFLPLR